MKMTKRSLPSIPVSVQRVVLLAAFLAPQVALAAQWNVKMGARSYEG